MLFDKSYWQSRYDSDTTGWDIGGPSTPLKEYFDQLEDRSISILIPGAGNAYEAEYLHQLGFPNVTVIDLAIAPLENLQKRAPGFPEANLVQGDFFEHNGQYDLIVEQTFFCALNPKLRPQHAQHTSKLLKPGGKLVGLLFDDPLFTEHPPFGGNKAEYIPHFASYYDFMVFDRAHNSIPPRADRELFILFQKKG